LPEVDKVSEKVGIFVDVQNIYYTCRQTYQGNFDYNKFWAKVTKDRDVVCAYAYATDRGDAKQIQFQNILRAIGFDVQLKAVLKRRDGTAKADWMYSKQPINAIRLFLRRAMAISGFCLIVFGIDSEHSQRSMAFER
jgi:hypothetical protein